jgi:hypothetical protein
VTRVIDAGRVKELGYDPSTRMSSLKEVRGGDDDDDDVDDDDDDDDDDDSLSVGVASNTAGGPGGEGQGGALLEATI